MPRAIFFSMESIARALSLSCAMVFLRKVFILFNVEKHLSDSDVVMGVVMRMFKRLTVSANVSSPVSFLPSSFL